MSSSHITKECSLCKRRDQGLRLLPGDYCGPHFEPSGKKEVLWCCRNCLHFTGRWKLAIDDTFSELPQPPHKRLRTALDEWLLAAHELRNDPVVALRERLYGRVVIDAVQEMSHNNPARKSILQWCSADVSVKAVAIDFGLSSETVYAAKRETTNFLMDLKYTPGVKRERVRQGDHDTAMLFLNETFPITSGREYRVISVTDDFMYILYVYFCQDRCAVPLGKTYFIANVVNKINVRRTTDSAMCAICKKIENLRKLQVRTESQQEELEGLLDHKNLWKEQIDYYKLRKNLLAQGKPEEVIVVQDFTQLQVQGTFYQDLIIATYTFNPNVVGRLECIVTHFVASSSREKNDVNFVIRAWCHLILHGNFRNHKSVVIFSDGAGKHFKATSMMTFMGWLKKHLAIHLEYNFFETNHGHNVCDAAAASAKKGINVYQRDTGIAVRTPEQIVEVIVNIKNQLALVSPKEPIETVPEFATFAQIRKVRKVMFSDTHALGYKKSRDGFEFASWPMDFSFYDHLDAPNPSF